MMINDDVEVDAAQHVSEDDVEDDDVEGDEDDWVEDGDVEDGDIQEDGDEEDDNVADDDVDDDDRVEDDGVEDDEVKAEEDDDLGDHDGEEETDPKTRARTLREPAQSKCTWTFYNSHLAQRSTVKMPERTRALFLTGRTFQSVDTLFWELLDAHAPDGENQKHEETLAHYFST